MNYKTKRTLKQILSVALAGLAAFGAIFGLVKLSEVLKEETEVIHPTFSVGGLNASGEYEDTDGSIYTKDSFGCQGLTVKLDFDSNVTYQAFYYDELDKYISSSTVYDESMELGVPETAVYARLEVTPIWADDVVEEDRIVKWYNVAGYANQLEISVNKEQLSPEELFMNSLENADKQKMTCLGTGVYDMSSNTLQTNTSSNWHFFNVINGTDYDELIIKMKTATLTATVDYNGTARDAFVLYNLDAGSSKFMSALTYTVLHVDGDCSYVSFDITDYGEFCFALDQQSVDVVEVWLR